MTVARVFLGMLDMVFSLKMVILRPAIRTNVRRFYSPPCVFLHLLEQVRVAAAHFQLLAEIAYRDHLPAAQIARHLGDGSTRTSVERWMRQNSSGSSSSASSFKVLRIRNSDCSVCTRVYFSSARKNSTSRVLIMRRLLPTTACIQRRYSGLAALAAGRPSSRALSWRSMLAGCLPSSVCSRAQVVLSRSALTGLSR